MAFRENPPQDEIARRVAAGVSPNYRGDYTLARNRPANIPTEKNCSVWITGLPPTVTTHQLLGAIRDVGRVWAAVLSPPTMTNVTAAAKVTFFTAEAAQTLLARCNGPGPGGLPVGDRIARVQPDRNAVAAATEPIDHTRVISIAGPTDVVNESYLGAYFSSTFVYEVDEVIWLVAGRAINIIEWRFGSYRCQAQWAYERLRQDQVFLERGVRVNFERDPCDCW